MSTGRPKKEGFLTKEGYKVRNWKKRWFVLGKETLSYYQNQKSLRKVLGVISLKDILGVDIGSYKKKESALHVKTPRRTYYFAGDNKSILNEWKVAIEEQLENLHGRAQNDGKRVDLPEEKVNADSFEVLCIIGQGSFGKVVQVRMKSTGDIFAMKILNKKNIIDRGEIEHTKAEKSILMRINHPFLMKLHYSFQTIDKLYLVMDFVNGGELFYHLQNERRFSNERARFYAAEIVLGIEHLHNNGIIYRDLKPENLLLDATGHIKMTDFGLSKEGLLNDDKTNTFCGTPEYLAPEVLDGQDYGKAVDWWSLGTLVFEMLTGLPPFYDEDVQKMYGKKMSAELVIPDYVEDSARELIQLFLDRNPETRLQDSEQIKKHAYFQSIDWSLLFQRQLEPPYKPSVSSKDSTKLIDRQFTNMDVKKELGPVNNPQSGAKDEFEGFTYLGGPNGPAGVRAGLG